jgi:hypothetical protein
MSESVAQTDLGILDLRTFDVENCADPYVSAKVPQKLRFAGTPNQASRCRKTHIPLN